MPPTADTPPPRAAHDRLVATLRAQTVWPLYVPTDAASPILRGSAVTGVPVRALGEDRDDALAVDFEGNRYGGSQLSRWADRAEIAVGRCQERYPTVARMRLPSTAMVHVGSYDTAQGVITVESTAHARVAAWLGLPEGTVIPTEELETSSGRSKARRDLLRMRETRPDLAALIDRELRTFSPTSD